jgi:hypothetical protein
VIQGAFREIRPGRFENGRPIKSGATLEGAMNTVYLFVILTVNLALVTANQFKPSIASQVSSSAPAFASTELR